jgi:D-glycero-alpha-D-manno-heptose-7-phosphate kinase
VTYERPTPINVLIFWEAIPQAQWILILAFGGGTVSLINISRSPLRISFFGGGTDYPTYFHHNPGAVLGASIDKYIYTIALPMADFAENRYRITYRIVEGVDRVEDIKHNVIRATLLEMGYVKPLNIAIISDLPGNSGLGSSSSFTVGFIALMEYLQGRSITKFDLFKRAVHTERDLLKENVGIQDQIHAAFGGLNLYQFHKDELTIRPAQMATECRNALDRSLCLVYTGIQRHASATVQEQLKNTEEKKIQKDLTHLVKLCHDGLALLEGRNPEAMLSDLGKLVSEGWETKRRLSTSVTLPQIDAAYNEAMRLGAYGGKLCGAGGGGFLLFMAPDHVQSKMMETFGHKSFVKISLEDAGASIISR